MIKLHLMKSALCTRHPSKSMSAEDNQNFVKDTQYFRKSVFRSGICSTHLKITLLIILHMFSIMLFPLSSGSSTYLQQTENR